MLIRVVLIRSRSHLAVGVGTLVVAGAIAAGIALAFGGQARPLTPDAYLARVQAICEKYARKLDQIFPPADIATPAEIIYSVGAALPVLKQQTATAKAVPVPTTLRPLVERFFENERSLVGLDEALDSARASDFGGLGHGYVQFLRARSAAAAQRRHDWLQLVVRRPGSTVPNLARETQALQGRRERSYWTTTGATEDTAARRVAAARANSIPRTVN